MSDWQSSALMIRRRPEVDIARSMQRFAQDADAVVRKARAMTSTVSDAPRNRAPTLSRGVKVKAWTQPADVEKASVGGALRAVGRGVKRVFPGVLGAAGKVQRVGGAALGGAVGLGSQSAKEAARGFGSGFRYVTAAMQPRTVASAGKLIAPIDPTRAVGGVVTAAGRHILKPAAKPAPELAAPAVPRAPKSAKTKTAVRAARSVKPAAAPAAGAAPSPIRATPWKPVAVPTAPTAGAKPPRPRNPPLRYKKPGAMKQPGLPLEMKADWSGALWVLASALGSLAKSITPGSTVTLWQKPFRVHSYDAEARKYRLVPEKKIPNVAAVKVHERHLGVPHTSTIEPSVGTATARREAKRTLGVVREARTLAARQVRPTVKAWLPSSPTRRAIGGRAADILARRKRERRADVSDAMTRRERRQGARATAQAEAREADYARAARKMAPRADTILDRLDAQLVRASAREAVLAEIRKTEVEKVRAEMMAEAARPINDTVTVEKDGATVTLRRADTLAYRPEDIGRGC